MQDAAAALPARLLDARPGERVLDLCAAPGGKTLAAGRGRGRGDGAGYLWPPAGAGARRTWRGRGLTAADRRRRCAALGAGRAVRRDPAGRALFGDRHDPAPSGPALRQGRVGGAGAGRLAGAAARPGAGVAETRRAAGLLPPARFCPRRARRSSRRRWSGIRGWRSERVELPGVEPGWSDRRGRLAAAAGLLGGPGRDGRVLHRAAAKARSAVTGHRAGGMVPSGRPRSGRGRPVAEMRQA